MRLRCKSCGRVLPLTRTGVCAFCTEPEPAPEPTPPERDVGAEFRQIAFGARMLEQEGLGW